MVMLLPTEHLNDCSSRFHSAHHTNVHLINYCNVTGSVLWDFVMVDAMSLHTVITLEHVGFLCTVPTCRGNIELAKVEAAHTL